MRHFSNGNKYRFLESKTRDYDATDVALALQRRALQPPQAAAFNDDGDDDNAEEGELDDAEIGDEGDYSRGGAGATTGAGAAAVAPGRRHKPASPFTRGQKSRWR